MLNANGTNIDENNKCLISFYYSEFNKLSMKQQTHLFFEDTKRTFRLHYPIEFSAVLHYNMNVLTNRPKK